MAKRGAGPHVRDSISHEEVAAFLILGPAAGAFLFGVAFVVYTVACESFVLPALGPLGRPRLTYGIEWMLSGLLACGLGGAAGLAPLAVRFPRPCGGMLIIPAGLAASLAYAVALWWRGSLSRYGPDSSDLLTYVPMLIASGLTLVVAVAAGMVLVVRHFRRGG